MSEYHPYEEFKWLKNFDIFDGMSINEKVPIRHFLEVDLHHFDKLHELYNYYSLAPEKFLVICCQNIFKKLFINMR